MLRELLNQNNIKPARVVSFDLTEAIQMDFSKDNEALHQLDLNDKEAFSRFVFDQIPEGTVGIGGYGEVRHMYNRSELFVDGEPRTIHLGVDLWANAGTPVYAPLAGRIHSFDNRAFHGDYGPVIILEHQLGDQRLFSLYGHLSVQSLEGKKVGEIIRQGEEFAWLGTYDENFHWPPHLHFQLMWDMQGHVGDYPGVCKASEKESYLANCPDPTVILE
jgi:murein DD-endopeptidase MepM/ murein hydrolase activator NlpD